MSIITPSAFDQDEYQEILRLVVVEIRASRSTIARQVNRSTNSVYWNLGKLLVEKQLSDGYGSGVVKQLSTDLKGEFPGMELSPRNLWNMKRFYERYHQEDEKLLQLVAVLPWGHNLLLLDKIQSVEAVRFYADEIITKGWSRNLLLNAIKMDSYSQAKKQIKTHNFDNRDYHVSVCTAIFEGGTDSCRSVGMTQSTDPERFIQNES